jgi:hypothetical protein
VCLSATVAAAGVLFAPPLAPAATTAVPPCREGARVRRTTRHIRDRQPESCGQGHVDTTRRLETQVTKTVAEGKKKKKTETEKN